MRTIRAALILAPLCLSSALVAQSVRPRQVPADELVPHPGTDGSLTWLGRCSTPTREERLPFAELFGGVPGDCDADSTNPIGTYDPGDASLVEVWVHIIQSTGGDGVIPDSLVHSQIAILNEDFRAITGTLGANGNDSAIYFKLAGITRTTNDSWFADPFTDPTPPPYTTALAVDPANFLNVYTNSAGGDLGYVPFLPTDAPPGTGPVGTTRDRVVIYWESFGRNSPYGPPYDQGRTATHEFGHFFGLEHVFSGGCGTGTSPGCYSSGDLICDTNADSAPHFGCPVAATSCSSTPVPIENYMEYTDDTCMELFTVEQRRRMRCALQYYRASLGTPILFYDGFEIGATGGFAAWSSHVP